MTFVKQELGLKLPSGENEQAIWGGYEQAVFVDDVTGRQIFYYVVTINPPYNPTYIVHCEPVDAYRRGISGATIQLSDSVSGKVLGTGITKIPLVKPSSGAAGFGGNAFCDIVSPQNTNIFLEIL